MNEPAISLEIPDALLGYPAGSGTGLIVRRVLQAPVLIFRLGLGWALPPTILLLTTTGRRSGLPRRTPLEFRRHGSKRYALSAWGVRADWYQNLSANPIVRIQQGRHNLLARATPITDTDELWRVIRLFRRSNPLVDALLKRTAGLAADATPHDLFQVRERLSGARFDPLDGPVPPQAPPPVRPDLAWVWGVLAGVIVAVFLGAWRARRRT
ncbi:MAG: nitroreductase family deazaflavin-dependent oxidoreductase [Anaerolineae bacterium]|nr:nitroreductase family deazaflavin-dependent oxidoreductase [Anaerolineae bacterium]